MDRFLITTDSGCDLPETLLAEKRIGACRIAYTLDGQSVPDPMDGGKYHEFYERMRAGAVPKTSQLNAFELSEYWESLMPADILHISLGSGISGTCANALQAREMLREKYPEQKIIVVDSLLASVGYGMLCLDAVAKRDEGCTIEETEAYLLNERHRVNTWYTTGDLEYLYRSGRVSRLSAAVGTALHINPILNLDDEGHLIVRDRIRGRKKAMRVIADHVGRLVEEPGQQTLFICHSDVPEEAREFGEAIKEEFGFRSVYYTYIGTSIGAHCGPGLVAAFFKGKERTK